MAWSRPGAGRSASSPEHGRGQISVVDEADSGEQRPCLSDAFATVAKFDRLECSPVEAPAGNDGARPARARVEADIDLDRWDCRGCRESRAR